MKLFRTLLSVIPLFLYVCVSWASGSAIVIGTDQNYWFPYSYAENSKAKGIHVDIVALALANLGYQAEFVPLPWKRCLKEAEEGEIDAIVSASYKPERAKYLFYPKDAAVAKESLWRIMQVEYVIISLQEATYQFTGDINALPPPVRAPLGYSIIDDFKLRGVDVVAAPNVLQCMEQLLLSKRGVVVTARQNAETLLDRPQFKDLFRIHSMVVTSKSYFMAFSKKTKTVNTAKMQTIWEEISRLRKDKSLMAHLFKKYES